MRIKALPLSQSKQEKRTEGVITIQRGKDSWNQRPQTSGSLTPPLTRAPRTRALPPCRDESRMGKSRTDRYRITDFVSFVPIDFEPDVKNENGTKTRYTKR
jgi:hypothetical protein